MMYRYTPSPHSYTLQLTASPVACFVFYYVHALVTLINDLLTYWLVVQLAVRACD